MSKSTSKKKPVQALDEFHFHEVLDRCSMIQSLIYDYIRLHPAVATNRELMDKAEEAIGCLNFIALAVIQPEPGTERIVRSRNPR